MTDVSVSTTDLPPDKYVSIRSELEAAVESAKAKVDKLLEHHRGAQEGLTQAQAALDNHKD